MTAVDYPLAAYSIKEIQQSFLFESSDSDWVNPFTELFKAIIKQPRSITMIYETSVPVTTQSAFIYGTMSMWTIIVACSGYLHPQQIPQGTKIRLPSLDAVYSVVKKERETLAGKTIVF